MAEAKKTAVKKAAPKKADVVKSVADLRKELAEKQADIVASRRSHRAGELP